MYCISSKLQQQKSLQSFTFMILGFYYRNYILFWFFFLTFIQAKTAEVFIVTMSQSALGNLKSHERLIAKL